MEEARELLYQRNWWSTTEKGQADMPQGANRKLGDIALASLRAAESGRNLWFFPAAWQLAYPAVRFRGKNTVLQLAIWFPYERVKLLNSLVSLSLTVLAVIFFAFARKKFVFRIDSDESRMGGRTDLFLILIIILLTLFSGLRTGYNDTCQLYRHL